MRNSLRVLSLILCALMLSVCFVSCGGTTPVDADTQTSADTSALTEPKHYIISSDNSFAPFEYFDTEKNAYVGLDMDIMAAVAEDQGFTYEMKNEGFDASMGSVQSGQSDGMIAGMTIKPERAETFDFSDGYFEDGQIMVVKADSTIASLADLKGLTVAAKTSTMGAEYAEAHKEEGGYTIVYYEDSPAMYTAVINGTNAACFEDRSVIGWAITEEKLDLKTIGEVLNPASYGFAVKKGENAELITMFNAGLASIKASGKYTEILAKYGY